MTAPSLRPATPADRAWVWRLKKITMRAYVVQTWGLWDDAFQRSHFQTNFEPANLEVIMVGGRDVGYLQCERARHEIFLANISVEPSFQNRGLGSAVIRELQAQAAATRLPIRLQVLKTNPAARRLYARLGFSVIDETPTHTRMLWRPD